MALSRCIQVCFSTTFILVFHFLNVISEVQRQCVYSTENFPYCHSCPLLSTFLIPTTTICASGMASPINHLASVLRPTAIHDQTPSETTTQSQRGIIIARISCIVFQFDHIGMVRRRRVSVFRIKPGLDN